MALADDATQTLESAERVSAPSRFRIGERVASRYAILKQLGAGGMGEVYEALDEQLSERVALKVIRPYVAMHATARDRFRREIQLARRVTHAYVCRLFDLGTDGDTWFCTMELVAGETLAQRLRRDGHLAERDALAIVTPIIAALKAAHRVGVVHGDLKPSNVLLGERIVVTDFGLAHGCGELTEAGVGSPAYIAPEQLVGGEIGPAADVFALGVVMFQMITGKLPFVGDTAHATAALRMTTEAPSATGVSSRWRHAIARCLRRDPTARPASARAVLAALTASQRARVASRLAICACVLVLTGGAVVGVARATRDPIEAPSATVVPPAAAAAYAEGLGHLRALDYVPARTSLRAAIAAAPAFGPAYAALSEAAWSLGDEVDARTAAKEAVDLAFRASLGERLSAEGHAWEANGEASKATEVYARLVALAPADVDTRFALLRAQWRAGDATGVRATIDALRGGPAADDLRVAVGEVHVASAIGDWPAALAASERLVHAGAEHCGFAFEGRIGEAESRWALGDYAGANVAFVDAANLAVASGDANAVAGTRLRARPTSSCLSPMRSRGRCRCPTTASW